MSTTIFTTATNSASIESVYKTAKERYAALGVDTEAALKRLAGVPVSLHCWQGDDVGGFEKAGQELGGGLAVTGNYPGKARTPAELRGDAVKALALIPGKHRFNLHALYAETGGKRVDRNELCPEHFKGWIDWCKEQGLGMDFKYFDASINRVAAWVIGTRAMLKALLIALLEPIALLRDLEKAGDFTARLAMLEELKTLPFAAVWDYHCLKQNVPVGPAWIGAVKQYEKDVLSKRS